MSLLIMENIVKEYKGKVILNGVSLRIQRGERVALVGPNGSGKTTLLKIAMGLEVSDAGSVTVARNAKVAYLSQGMEEFKNTGGNADRTALYYENVSRLELKMRKVEKQMEELSGGMGSEEYEKLLNSYSKLQAQYEAMDGYTIESKIRRILMGLGLREECLTIPVSSLSGGEKMLVALARILLEEPDLIILDEPTNHLDIQATEWLEGFLKGFAGGVLIVSHDRYFLDQVGTRIAELENGSITERSCSYSMFIEQKKKLKEYVLKQQRDLMWKIRHNNEIVQGLKGMGRIRASQSRQIIVGRLEEQLEGSRKMFHVEHFNSNNAPKIAFKKIRHVSKDIAWADGLCKSFGEVSIFKGASFHIRGGEHLAIIGPNGCGKTTLINILLGLDTDFNGTAKLGEWVKYSYMGQEIIFQDESRTILEEIMSKKEMKEIDARNHAARFQFYGDEVNMQISVLSGGERVRLLLASIMLDEPDCLIMDEPTNHLDIPAREAVEKALSEFKGTVIAVSHDRYFLNHCVDRILEVSDRKINAYSGGYDSYKKEKAYRELSCSSTMSTGINSKKDYVKTKALKPDDGMDAVEIEKQIMNLEEKAKVLENEFDKSTSPDKYQEYADITAEITRLYSIWDVMTK